jgi:hypothetical protein
MLEAFLFTQLVLYGVAPLALAYVLLRYTSPWMHLGSVPALALTVAQVVMILKLLARAPWARRTLVWTTIASSIAYTVALLLPALLIVPAPGGPTVGIRSTFILLAPLSLLPVLTVVILSLPPVVAACDGQRSQP